jgi:predicted nucleotidyltransferase
MNDEITENTQFSWKKDKVLCAIVDELKMTYHCHTIILYGSRARGDFNPASDYDVAGISANITEKQWIARFDEAHQVFHDIFIFSERDLKEPNESHLQISDGIVLMETNHFGTNLLKQLQTLLHQSIALSNSEIQSRGT